MTTTELQLLEIVSEAMTDILEKKNIQGSVSIKTTPPGIEVEMIGPEGWLTILELGIRGGCQIRDIKKEPHL